jgi:hypothetical protein
MTPQERNAVIEECLSVIRPPDENCNCGQCRGSRANREAVATLKQHELQTLDQREIRLKLGRPSTCILGTPASPKTNALYGKEAGRLSISGAGG